MFEITVKAIRTKLYSSGARRKTIVDVTLDFVENISPAFVIIRGNTTPGVLILYVSELSSGCMKGIIVTQESNELDGLYIPAEGVQELSDALKQYKHKNLWYIKLWSRIKRCLTNKS